MHCDGYNNGTNTFPVLIDDSSNAVNTKIQYLSNVNSFDIDNPFNSNTSKSMVFNNFGNGNYIKFESSGGVGGNPISIFNIDMTLEFFFKPSNMYMGSNSTIFLSHNNSLTGLNKAKIFQNSSDISLSITSNSIVYPTITATSAVISTNNWY